MLNPKKTVIPGKEESIYFFEHKERKLKFAVEGYGLQFHVNEIAATEDDHMIVLSDAYILTGFDFREFKIYPECPRDMSKILELFGACGQQGMLRPEIQITPQLFNAAYGIKPVSEKRKDIEVEIRGDVSRGKEFSVRASIHTENKGLFEGLGGIDHTKLPEMKWDAHPIGLTTVYENADDISKQSQRVIGMVAMVGKRKLAGEYKVAMENCAQVHQKVSDLYLDLLEITKSLGRDAGLSPQYRQAVKDIRSLMELIAGIQERWGNYVPLVGKFT